MNQDALYEQAVAAHGGALDRLARAYEFDPDHRQDLLQEMHLQLWRSLAQFDGRCGLRTWIYRVAHNVAAGHVDRQRRTRDRLVGIENIEAAPDPGASERSVTRSEALGRLSALVQRLKPLDRQVILCYLEGLDAAATSEVTGLSAANVAVKIHRIKAVLKRWFEQGDAHD